MNFGLNLIFMVLCVPSNGLVRRSDRIYCSTRNVRKSWRQSLEGDALKSMEKTIQKCTDDAIGKIDELLKTKVLNL